MNIQTVAALLATVTLAACGGAPSPAPSQLAATGNHLDAGHCEIFIDQISDSWGSHGIKSLTVYIKTLNGRLDGAVAEVGVRKNVTSQIPHEPTPSSTGWHDERAVPYFGAADYFQTSFGLGSDYSTMWSEAVFYVRTVTGTTYWLKPAPGRNYVIDTDLFGDIYDLYRNKYPYGGRIPTQDEAVLRPLNPSRCY